MGEYLLTIGSWKDQDNGILYMPEYKCYPIYFKDDDKFEKEA